MKNKGYFTHKNTEKSGINKTSLIVIIVIAFFIPAIAATLILMGGSGDTDTVTEKYTQASLYYEGELLFEEKSTPQDTEKSNLVDIFTSMTETMVKIDAPLRDVKNEKMLRIIITTESLSEEYNCFFSEKENQSFCTGKDSTIYRINSDVAFSFMTSPYSEVLYPGATPPKLQTTSNDTVIPSSADWKYKTVDKKMADALKVKTSTEELLYDMAGALGLNFEVQPDTCKVEIYKSGIIAYQLSSSDLSSITVDPGTTLQFKVTATWKESADSDFSGTVNYNFKALLRDRSEFVPNRTSLETGDFIVVSATNVIDASKVQFSSVPDIGFSPIFFKDGDLARALIPFDNKLDAGIYKLTFTHGAATETIDIELSVPSVPSTVTVATQNTSAFNTITAKSSLDELSTIIKGLGRDESEHIFFRTPFVDYGNDPSLSPLYNYGTVFESADGNSSHTLQGVEYTTTDLSSISVTALNSGIVVSTGNSAYLGNFVIIEHGLGLRTIYGHLSSIEVQKGDNVVKSQSIGRSGALSNTSANGVLIMCYVFNTAVDYNKIAGQETLLTNNIEKEAPSE